MSLASRWQQFILLSSLAAIAACAVGCGGVASTGSKTQTASASVSPSAGGTVALADGSAKLDVPPGAVSSTTMITMTTTTATAPAGITADGPILKFEPDGLVFATPVTVTFTFKSATSPVVYWSNSAGGYDVINGTVTGDSIAAQVTHFSQGFVGEAPSSTDKCNGGLSCAAGATCAYGGSGSSDGGTSPVGEGPSTGGDGTNAPDAGVRNGSGGGSSSSGGGTSSVDAGVRMSALSSTDPAAPSGSVAMCCACTGGVFQCNACSASGVGSRCVAGAAWTAGSRCGGGTNSGSGSGTSPATGGGSTSTGGGSSSPDAGLRMSALSSTDPAGTGSCCTCGSDGTDHCSACTGTSGGADASTMGPGGTCAQGATCQPGNMCGDNPASGCEQCTCGADGTYACEPCPGFADGGVTSPDGGGVITGGGMCVPGAACTPGAGGPCEDASPSSCLMCSCGADGTLACVSCGAGGIVPGPTGARADRRRARRA